MFSLSEDLVSDVNCVKCVCVCVCVCVCMWCVCVCARARVCVTVVQNEILLFFLVVFLFCFCLFRFSNETAVVMVITFPSKPRCVSILFYINCLSLTGAIQIEVILIVNFIILPDIITLRPLMRSYLFRLEGVYVGFHWR